MLAGRAPSPRTALEARAGWLARLLADADAA
jgi:hypothetical protein